MIKTRHTHIAGIDAGHAAATKGPHALNHLVEELARVRLQAHRHLQPVQPALGVLASCALERDVGSAAITQLLEPGHDRVLAGQATGQLLVVDELQLVRRKVRPYRRQPRLRVDKDDLLGALFQRKDAGHLANGTSAENGHAIALFDARVYDAVVRSGQHI